MSVQVLLSCMNQTDFSILQKSNIRTSAIVVNQCGKNEVSDFVYNGRKIKFISLSSIGVGVSRNTALINSEDEILLFADDDVRYCDNYEHIIEEEFQKHPKADMICFNFKCLNCNGPGVYTRKFKRVRWMNCLRYGTYKIAVKRESIMKSRVCFSMLFGGGSRYGSGEDSFFVSDCVRAGMRVYASPKYLGSVEQKESTWFSGYNEKYYHDLGAFWAAYSRKFWKAFLLVFLLKKRDQVKTSSYSFIQVFSIMKRGAKNYKEMVK